MIITEEIRDKKLKELCTPDFLTKLSEVGRLYGWGSDYVEIRDFIESLHHVAKIEPPELEPHTINYTEE